MRRPPTLQELRAALWTWRAVRRARSGLRDGTISGLSLPDVPPVPESAARGVRAVLRRLPATCLERAVVLQRWRAAHGDLHDVVVGVAGTGATFQAHAWLDDEPLAAGLPAFRELSRYAP